MEILTYKEIRNISNIYGSCLCYRTLGFEYDEAKYHSLAFTTDNLGLIDKIYGSEDDLELTYDSIYYLVWNKLDWYKLDYYLLNLVNINTFRYHCGKLKASVIALYCLLGLTTEVLYELVTGQKRTF